MQREHCLILAFLTALGVAREERLSDHQLRIFWEAPWSPSRADVKQVLGTVIVPSQQLRADICMCGAVHLASKRVFFRATVRSSPSARS